MVLTPSTMLRLGTKVPDFRLPGVDGKLYSLEDFDSAPAFLVMFICNHCPYVKHINVGITKLIAQYQAKGVAAVAINANDVVNYPEDNVENMAIVSTKVGYTFPYLFDETQDVAKAYRASCTPDFFVFDSELKLVYRGQMDDSRPGNNIPVTGKDLRSALDKVIAGQLPSLDQKPSMGCNIKWKRGNEPSYF